ncbi:Salicylate hydroxylase [Penicillium atrosanguineum]|uniref:Salicylate hydroxylase n=1 Tax=Penicillium atrosanguineum TaxID=1132637 RepID=A0A9W9U096_9EURO|nr:Salicylate hydroxylase [Penicillium atrosanguineum]
MNHVRPPRDIAIVGAGFAGVACALAITQELGPSVPNLKIRVFERSDYPSTSGGAVNLTPVAQRHLTKLGVMQELNRMGTYGGADIDAVEVFSMNSARPIGSVDFRDRAGKSYCGFKGRRVMRVVLLTAMIAVAERANVKFVYSKKVIGGEEINDSAVVHFEDGTCSHADLVVGCDGVHSLTRTTWVDPDCPSEYSGMSFLQTTVDTNEISSPLPCDSALHLSRYGSLITTYCDRDRERIFAAAIVQFTEEEIDCYRLKPGQDWDTRNRIKSSLRNQLQCRFRKSAEPCVKEIVHSDQEWMLYPVYLIRPGGRWCMNRVALLGDAAHAMPPIYSSASYALDDAILFARVLARYRLEPLYNVFDTYEKLRRDTVDNAFVESNRIWNRMKDRGSMDARVRDWKMASYLKHDSHKLQKTWNADAAMIPIPTPEATGPLLSMQTFLRASVK